MSRARVASLLAVASLTAPAALEPAGALALSRGYGAGRQYCAEFGGWASSYSFDGVYACGATESRGPTPFDADGDESFQCVELSARFLWMIYGIWAGPGTGVRDGAELVGVVHAQHPSIRVGYPTPGSVPVAGDVVSLGPGGAVDPEFGHTGVVIADDQRRGRFTIIGQNFPPGRAGEQALQVDFSGRHNGRALLGGAWTPASWLELRKRPSPPARHKRRPGRRGRRQVTRVTDPPVERGADPPSQPERWHSSS
jgi:CHAP domain-containing protein